MAVSLYREQCKLFTTVGMVDIPGDNQVRCLRIIIWFDNRNIFLEILQRRPLIQMAYQILNRGRVCDLYFVSRVYINMDQSSALSCDAQFTQVKRIRCSFEHAEGICHVPAMK